jgi:predicted ester cyclase
MLARPVTLTVAALALAMTGPPFAPIAWAGSETPAEIALDRHDAAVAAYNAHDLEAMMDFYAEHATLHDPLLPEPAEGHAAIRESYEAMMEGFPDARVEILSRDARENLLTYDLRFVATKDGTLPSPQGELPPTGQRVDVPMTIVVRLDGDGRAIEARRDYDADDLMAQLGLAR